MDGAGEPFPAFRTETLDGRAVTDEIFAGKTADDLSLVAPGFFERPNLELKLNAKVTGIDRAARTVALATSGKST